MSNTTEQTQDQSVLDKIDSIVDVQDYLRNTGKEKIDFDALYKQLLKKEQFGYAAEMLFKKLEENPPADEAVKSKNYQDLAKCIYKDDTLSSYFKFDEAYEILKEHCELNTTSDYETLGLAGAIHKYKWKFDHQPKNLLLSEAYYSKGYEKWKKNASGKSDDGYTAINYAFISELIAADNLEHLSKVTGIKQQTVDRYLHATEARESIINAYIDDTDGNLQLKEGIEANAWLFATLAEAYFGLRKYDEAEKLIEKYLEQGCPSWEIKTFMRQLHHIAYMQRIEQQFAADHKGFSTKDIVDDRILSCLSAFEKSDEGQCKVTIDARKKIGLCLSGGGFRAALFHIGVLAGLAEQDRLKDIEVISCVSGGSIIGAYYYLHLRKLLTENTEQELNEQYQNGTNPYVEMVKTIEKEFLKGVQKNIRMRLYSNILQNIKMVFDSEYSRSYRLGELYEEVFYKDFFKEKNGKPIYMSDLLITPAEYKDKETEFKISDNWSRTYKVPQLILNAATINTGHNWQFTATWMGEPPTYIADEFDVKPRMRRMYYRNAPKKYHQFRLGYAVAASSCVPLLFEPLVLKGLYEDIDLELVDGGVHDNQGIASILEQECDNIIVSDGSAQMGNENNTVGNGLPLFVRVDTIVQERVREIQLLDLKSREYTATIANLEIVHLKSGLNQMPVQWIGCTDVPRKINHITEQEVKKPELPFGISREIQQLLSEIRTDLDSHNDMEASALMYSGYRQIMKDEFDANEEEQWAFSRIANTFTNETQLKKLNQVLKIASYVPFKVLRINRVVLYATLLLLAVLFFWLCANWWNNDTAVISYSWMVRLSAVLLFVYLTGRFLKVPELISNPQGWLKKKGILLVAVLIGWLICGLYLTFANRIYNYFGKLAQSKDTLTDGILNKKTEDALQ